VTDIIHPWLFIVNATIRVLRSLLVTARVL